MSGLPICCVTGRIAGDGFACGDCDPCSATHLVPEVVKRLIKERDEWAEKYEQAMTKMDELRFCSICGDPLKWEHDHKPDNSGLDDGPYLPGRAPRKAMEPKSPEETRAIRAQAWATRREKYGPNGHR